MARLHLIASVVLAACFIPAIVARKAALACNGSVDYCSLPYDRYTFAGTHNSAAYKLVPDCANIEKCEKAKDICLRKEDRCWGGFERVCTQSAQKCIIKVPERLGGACLKWNKVCTKAASICKGVKAMCTKPMSVCTNGLPSLCKNIPGWMRRCLWENQPGHDIGRQLEDGIRAFDIDTCVTADKRVVTCHGKGPSRALGAPLDEHLRQIRAFLRRNPREVITLEYNDYDGDIVVNGLAIKQAVERYLGGMLHAHGGPGRPWPTLGEMLSKGKQVVVFFGEQIRHLPLSKPPAWGHYRYAYYDSTWNYTNIAHDSEGVIKAMYNYVASNKAKPNVWQCLDFEYSPSIRSIMANMAQLEQPAVCLKRLAREIAPGLEAIAATYSARFERIHRVRVDYYYNRKEQLLNVVERLNARNLRIVDAINRGRSNHRRNTS